jgi:hypothetical protein
VLFLRKGVVGTLEEYMANREARAEAKPASDDRVPAAR